jgi:uncharacterized protein YjbI with pentapeptide repeats
LTWAASGSNRVADASNVRLLNIRERQLTGAWLDGANLSGARLDEANLSGAFGKADLSSAQLTMANLSGSPARLGELVFRLARCADGPPRPAGARGKGMDRRHRSRRWVESPA